MYWKKSRIILASTVAPILIALNIGLLVGKNFLWSIEDTITSALCPPIKIETFEEGETAAEGFDLAKQIVSEGSVLVKNDNNTLPLNKDSQKKVNVFGHGSVDWIIGGSGSGQVVPEQGAANILFLDALSHYGVEYNSELTTMYRNFFAPLGTVDSLNKFYKDFYKLYEPAITNTSYYTSGLLTNAKSFSDTALVVLSRRAGETEDPPREQYKVNPNTTDSSRHYLEISTEEEGLLRYVGENFEHVVVIINSTNTMELDFLKTIPGLDACLIVGATGTRGAEQIPYVLYGDNAYPSGRTVDTYPYDFKYNINYGYTGLENIRHYSNGSNLYPHGVSRNAGVQYTDSPSYVDYVEGVYLGYKWFETADHVGYWDRAPYNGYANVVQFPFGYGLSYTSFSWEVESVSPSNNSEITNNSEINLRIKVTNEGELPGKDVIEAYVTAPYDDINGGIEKAYVSLVGTIKTPEIKPHDSLSVALTIYAKDFESYDCYDKNNNGFKGYELEAGEYELKLMENAHTVKKVKMGGASDVDGIIKYNVSSTIKVSSDEKTGHKVENRFTGASAEGGISIDGSDSNANINFISRNNFPDLGTFKAPNDRAITDNVKAYNKYTTAQADTWDNASTDIFGNRVSTSKPKFGVNPGSKKVMNNGSVTELGMRLGADYNSDEWDAVLDSIPLDQCVGLLNSGSFGSAAVDAVGKAKSDNRDGPAQVRSFNGGGGKPGTGFPCETVLAQTFSPDLAYKYGLNYGKEMNASGVDGAYAFGCNIHRSPFQGRNYEYMSEDGMLTGILLTKMVTGLQNTGKYCFLKHLAIAECEHEREAMYTWLTEQSLREIYLKPFQKVVQEANCLAMMTSYNRIGGIWTGGSEHLIQGILRYEWGFNGGIVTDYADHREFMNGANAYRAGGNLGMNTSFNGVSGFSNPTTSSSARLLNRVREATKQLLYMELSAKYQNQQYNINGDPDSQIISYSSIASWVWWKPTVIALQIVIFGGTILSLYFIFRPKPMKKIKEDK